MKNKFIGIIALLGVITFGFIACDTGNSPHTHTWGDWAQSSVWGMEAIACSGCSQIAGLRLTADMMADIPAGIIALSGTYTANLSAFKMGKYEVTQAQYVAVIGTNPSHFYTAEEFGEVQERRPVEYVDWYDAIEFCNKLSVLEGLSPAYIINKITQDPYNTNTFDTIKWTVNINSGSNGYRLPTEAQWEYACRAGTITTWYHGNDEAALINYAWFDLNSGNKSHQVGLKTPNLWGLYDMHGNVWEWCWDWNEPYPVGVTEQDPTGEVSGSLRVVRGGSWSHTAMSANSGNRGTSDPWSGSFRLGFRIVKP